MSELTWQGWFTLAVIGLVFVALLRNLGPPDILLMGGSVVVALVGIIEVDDLASGFANPGMLTIAALFVVTAAMRETGALDRVGKHMLGKAKTERGAFLRVAPQIGILSAFLNNTAIVAMAIPILNDWCRKRGVSPSRLLLPLSYVAILGGMCTLIGTSRNLIVSELMVEAAGATDDPTRRTALGALSMFELAWIGVPCALVGFAYLAFVGRRLLPERKDAIERFGESTRDYLVEMLVQPNCPLVGQRIEEAGLRRLPGLFLIEIARAGRIIAPVQPDETIAQGDRLTFSGVVSTIVDLERIPGFVPAADETYESGSSKARSRRLCEAVISATAPLIGQNVRQANFRARYNAAVVAIHRGGERLVGRIGDMVLRAGDTLLLQTGPHFVQANRDSADFFLVSSVEEVRPVRHDRAPLAFGLLALLVVLMVLPQVHVVIAAFTVAGLMIVTRCISAGDARRNVQWHVLLTIAGAFGLASALETSGASEIIGGGIIELTSRMGSRAALAVIYCTTVAIGLLITSNATAVLMFPLAIAVADQLGVNPRTFAIAVASAAAASFASPVSYQTNMLVYGAGGYRFTDFMRVGLPLNLLLAIVAILVIPWVWPLTGF